MTNLSRIAILAGFLATAALAQVPLTQTRYGPLAFQGETSLATNGRDVLLLASGVWEGDGIVIAARVVEGRPRQPYVLFNGAFHPRAIWTGTEFLVIATSYDHGVVARSVDTDGRPGKMRSIGWNNGEIATNGKTIAMVGTSYNFPWVIVERLRVDGSTIGRFAEPNFQAEAQAIASNGREFAVILATKNGVVLQFLDDQALPGESLDLGPRRIRNHAVPIPPIVAIASDGDGYLAAWEVDNGISARTITPDGRLGPELKIADHGDYPSVVRIGNRWLVTFMDEHDFRVVALDGDSISAPQTLAENTHPASIIDPGLVVWSPLDLDYPDTTILARRIDETKSWHTLESPVPQTLLRVVSTASATVVLWSEQNGQQQTLHAGFRGYDGSWSEQQLGASASHVVAASNGYSFFVIWSGARRTFAQWFHPDGRPYAPEPITIDLGFLPKDMVAHGGLYTVVGSSRDGSIEAALLSPNGSVLRTTPIARRTGITSFSDPTLATDGNQVLVLWSSALDYGYPVFQQIPLHAAWLDETLTPTITTLKNDGGRVFAAAWAGSSYVVIAGRADLRAIRVAPSASKGTETILRTRASEFADADVLPDGDRYSLALLDGYPGRVTTPEGLLWARERSAYAPILLTRLPDGDVALIASMTSEIKMEPLFVPYRLHILRSSEAAFR